MDMDIEHCKHRTLQGLQGTRAGVQHHRKHETALFPASPVKLELLLDRSGLSDGGQGRFGGLFSEHECPSRPRDQAQEIRKKAQAAGDQEIRGPGLAGKNAQADLGTRRFEALLATQA